MKILNGWMPLHEERLHPSPERSRSIKLSLVWAAAFLAAGTAASAQHVFDGNILWDNYQNGVLLNLTRGGSTTFDAVGLYNHFVHNDSLNPQLGDPYNKNAPQGWVTPGPTSPASGNNDDVVRPVVNARECDDVSCSNPASWAQLDLVCWRGAVPPAYMGNDWTQGWTYNNQNGGLGRTDIDYNKAVAIIQGDLTSNTHFTSDHNYLLRGRVNVLDGVTLTIDPGTVIFGEKATLGFLVVERGGKLIAEGTKDRPIIGTSDQLLGSMAPGDWGGIVINGKAIANCADCLGGQTCLSEGTESYHCGTNDCDNSGSLRYVRVEYSGHELSPNNELNSFTFNSVGSYTRIEYLNSFRGLDDLFEWFGGKCTAKYLVGQGGGDDGLDWQMGFRGYIQHAVIQQWGDGGSDKGVEADNNEFDYNAPCRSNPVLANITLVCVDHVAGTNTHGIHYRRGTDAQFYNSIIMGWKDTGLRVQNDETSARGFYSTPPVFCNAASVGPTVAASTFDVRTLNPVGQRALFFVNLPQSGPTRLSVFDMSGRLVHSDNDNLSAGAHTLEWNLPADHVSSGTYFYQVQNGEHTASGKLVAVR
jgi:hypothetical protein